MDVWEPWPVPSLARLPASLAVGEAIVAMQGNVGMYDGGEKVAALACGTAVLTTHRLAYVDDAAPSTGSRSVRLDLVRQTEHYSGFLKSSPKITLLLAPAATSARAAGAADALRAAWICSVCGFHNNARATVDPRCDLCGVSAAQGETPPASPPAAAASSTVCPACTFANHAAMVRCEMCDTALRETARRGDAATARDRHSHRGSVKLSFRAGGDRVFYAHLRTTLQAKPWLDTPATTVAPAGIDGALGAPGAQTGMHAEHMADAFRDLDALMAQAKHMVDFAQSLRAQLELRESSSQRGGETPPDNDEAPSLIQSAMVQLGLSAPAVTPDMVRGEREYYQELARELAGVLLGPPAAPGLLGVGEVDAVGDAASRAASSARSPGLIPLDEVWGVWNRARGVVLREAAEFLPTVTLPRIALRELRSGLTVLVTPRFDVAQVQARVLGYLDRARDERRGGLTTVQMAREEAAPLPLVQELLEGIEMGSGAIVRDQCAAQTTRWFRNVMVGARCMGEGMVAASV
ncbi:amidase [Malassezia sp. CBS 17886]|nr:amidase [Malassezia sp. CBS 17886]